MRRFAPVCAAVLALLVAACGDDNEQPAAPPAPAPADATQLTVEVTEAGPQPVRMSLRCGGTCDEERLRELVRSAGNRDRACTLQYGGPETAHVTGTVAGRPVDLTLTRSDGCGIADYAALFEAFGRRAPLAG